MGKDEQQQVESSKAAIRQSKRQSLAAFVAVRAVEEKASGVKITKMKDAEIEVANAMSHVLKTISVTEYLNHESAEYKVASLLHDDVLDDADKRRGIGSLNSVMGNKLAVLAGNFLLSRACISLAALNNTEVLTLIVNIIVNLVTGEMMQMTTTLEKRYRMSRISFTCMDLCPFH